MKELVLHIDAELKTKIKELANNADISVNEAAIKLLQKGASLYEASNTKIGNSLDFLIGAWSEEEADAFTKSLGFLDN